MHTVIPHLDHLPVYQRPFCFIGAKKIEKSPIVIIIMLVVISTITSGDTTIIENKETVTGISNTI